MDRYIGVKVIKARTLNRAEYNEYRGWKLPDDECATDDGYLVECCDGGKPNDARHDGYISWSPKEQFENAYRRTDGMSLGLAIEALKKGLIVARKAWMEGVCLVYISAKNDVGDDVSSIIFTPKNEYPNQLFTWTPSQADLLADDYYIVD